jgi:hypothetical protein
MNWLPLLPGLKNSMRRTEKPYSRRPPNIPNKMLVLGIWCTRAIAELSPRDAVASCLCSTRRRP